MQTDHLLTPEEFAERLRIGRSTLFEWLRRGIFVPGKHFVKVGRILRFIWSEEIVTCLSAATSKRETNGNISGRKTHRPGINWEY